MQPDGRVSEAMQLNRSESFCALLRKGTHSRKLSNELLLVETVCAYERVSHECTGPSTFAYLKFTAVSVDDRPIAGIRVKRLWERLSCVRDRRAISKGREESPFPLRLAHERGELVRSIVLKAVRLVHLLEHSQAGERGDRRRDGPGERSSLEQQREE